MENKFNLLKYLLFLPLLFLTFCQENNETITLNSEDVITKNSKVASLIKAAIKSDSDDDDDAEQCVEFHYPIALYVIFSQGQSIETIVINNDDELFNFFDTLTESDEIRIDFPLVLLDIDGEETIINSLTELEETLQIAVDACRGDDSQYDYCDDDNKKVYVCHNGNTLCVSVNAIRAHLDHGDELGQCDDDD